MSQETFLKIKKLLDDASLEYEHIVHEEVKTSSEAAAAVRGTDLADAAKAIIIKAKTKENTETFVQALVQGDKKIDLKKLKALLDMKNLSLASPEEVLRETDCTVGSVPPFGTLFGMRVYMDESLMQKDIIIFSAGTHTDSIRMKPEDYASLVNPVIADFKK